MGRLGLVGSPETDRRQADSALACSFSGALKRYNSQWIDALLYDADKEIDKLQEMVGLESGAIKLLNGCRYRRCITVPIASVPPSSNYSWKR